MIQSSIYSMTWTVKAADAAKDACKRFATITTPLLETGWVAFRQPVGDAEALLIVRSGALLARVGSRRISRDMAQGALGRREAYLIAR